MCLSWLFLSLIPKNEPGASDQDGEATRKNIPITRGILSTHFKINSILQVYLFYRYTSTVFVVVWAKNIVFTVWILQVIALVAQKLVGLNVLVFVEFLRRALQPA